MLYFFNLVTNDDTVVDLEGSELSDLESALFRATLEARSIISEEVKEGRLPMQWKIEVRNTANDVLMVVRFADVATLQ